jgi:hypothetical protein
VRVTSVVLAVAVILGATLLFFWSVQERVAYQPQGPPFPEVATRRVEYRASDGQPLFAYVVGDPTRSRGVLIVFHGNADLAAWQVDWASEVERHTGYSVVLAEYRGYMGLSGRPTYAGTLLDGRAAHAVVRDSFAVVPERIALFGHSVGSAIAAEIAAELRPHALLLQSPFTSTREMVGRMMGRPIGSLWRFLSRVPYDTRSRVAALDAPVSVVHGRHDEVIPVEMAEAVFAAAKNKGKLLIVENAGHNDVVLVGGDRYWRWVRSALLGDAEPSRPAQESAATMDLSARDRGTMQPGPSPTR